MKTATPVAALPVGELLYEVIAWNPLPRLPDAETNVLLRLKNFDCDSCEGFYDGHEADDTPIFRDVTGMQLPAGVVTHWAQTPGASAVQTLAIWPTGLLDRVKAAEKRVADNDAPRRIPADPHGDVDLVLAEVRYLIEGTWPPFWIKEPGAPAAGLQQSVAPAIAGEAEDAFHGPLEPAQAAKGGA